MQGANLEGASMQGANLNGASMQGANLKGASMQGANLELASLQGANLVGASMQGANLNGAFVWRTRPPETRPPETRPTNAYTETLDLSMAVRCDDRARNFSCPWTHESFAALRADVASAIPAGQAHDAALARIDAALDPARPFENERAYEQQWTDWRAQTATPDAADAERAIQLGGPDAACAAYGAPHAVAALIRRMHAGGTPGGDQSALFATNTPHRATLAKAFLRAECAGARGLPDTDMALLKQWAAAKAQAEPAR